MKFTQIKNVIFNWMGMVAAMIYAFFMTPFIVHHLGDTHYGLWNLIISCVGYMAIMDFGIQSSVNRYMAKYKGLGDEEGVSAIYSNSLAIYFCIGLAAVVLGLAITMNVESIFRLDPKDVPLARRVMLIMVLYTAIELPCNVFGALIYAYQRFDLLNGIATGILSVQAVLVWYILSHNANLWIFSWIIVACGMGKYLIQYLIAHRLVGTLRFREDLLSKSTLIQMITFSGITFLSIMVNYIILKTDNIVIGMFLSPQAITMYSIGFMLSDYTAQIVGKMCNTFTPVFSEHEARGEKHEIDSLLFNSCRFASLIGVPVGLTAIVVGKDFITLWMGKEYQGAYLIMVVMMIARMTGFPTASMYSMLYGIGKHYIALFTGIFEALVNLVLSIVLVHHYGILGVAVGTMIPMVIANVFFPVIVSRKMKTDLRVWLMEAIVRPGIFSIVFYLAISILCSFFRQVSWSGFIAQAIIIVLVYSMLFWFMGLRRHERSMLIARVRMGMAES